jgi:predicted metal-dependent RNase
LQEFYLGAKHHACLIEKQATESTEVTEEFAWLWRTAARPFSRSKLLQKTLTLSAESSTERASFLSRAHIKIDAGRNF